MQDSDLPDDAKKWWITGQRPDYRFSLANERTFLAWIRTSLALIAGGAAVHQFAASLGPEPLRFGLVLTLFGAGALLGGTAYWRWAAAERAMRHDQDLPGNPLLPFLAIFAALLALGLAALIMLS